MAVYTPCRVPAYAGMTVEGRPGMTVEGRPGLRWHKAVPVWFPLATAMAAQGRPALFRVFDKIVLFLKIVKSCLIILLTSSFQD